MYGNNKNTMYNVGKVCSTMFFLNFVVCCSVVKDLKILS